MGYKKEEWWETTTKGEGGRVTKRGERKIYDGKTMRSRDALIFVVGVAAMAILQMLAMSLR